MTQTNTNKVLWWITGLFAIVAVSIWSIQIAQKAFGSQTVSGPTCQTAAATSTLNYMTFGTGTTTLTCNYGLGVDKVYLKVQFSGSSTLSHLDIAVASSRNNIDYYPNNLVATTTSDAVIDIEPTRRYQLQFASSTAGDFMADGNIMTRLFELPAPDQYTRVTFTLASTTGSSNLNDIDNGAIWAQLVGKDEL